MERLKVIPETPEGKEAAKRLQGVINSLVKSGYINPRELPNKITVREAVGIIRRITENQCS